MGVTVVQAGDGQEFSVTGDLWLTIPTHPNRPYLLHLPTGYDPANPPPLVMALHGGGGNATAAQKITCPDGIAGGPKCLDAVADREGFVVAYPNGLAPITSPETRTWNAGGGKNGWRCTSGYACTQNSDDVGYIRALLDDLAKRYPYDPTRVYSSGISNGGRMSARLACELADRIAAIADLAGPNQFAMVEPCAPSRPVPILEFHGVADPINPYEGTPPDAGNNGSSSVNQSFAVWVAVNGCANQTTQSDLPDNANDGTKTTVFAYVGCKPGAPLIHYRTYGAGHTWPGGWQYFNESSVGKTARDFSANEEMWSFLRNQSSPAIAGDKWYDLPGWPGRPYLLHTPTNYNAANPPPLVLGIHGGGGNASSAQRITCPDGVAGGPKCLDAIADRETFLTAYPSGTGENPFPELRTWNAGGGRSGWACIGGVACRDSVDDVKYFHDLLDHIATHHPYNPARVYSTGISNGAAMSERLACEMPARIAAIGPVGGANQYATIDSCEPFRPIPIIQLHGVEDPLWPYYGGLGNGSTQGNFVSVKQSLDGWLARQPCQNGPYQLSVPDPANDGTNSTLNYWSGCPGGIEIQHYRITGGGHTWPDGYQYLGVAKIGRTSRDFSANEVIWGFFNRFKIEPNRAPAAPTITGPNFGKTNETLSFNVSAADPDGHKITYSVTWGDGTNDTSALVSSGTLVQLQNAWTAPGLYSVTPRAVDSQGLASPIGAAITVEIRSSTGTTQDRAPPVIVHTPVAQAVNLRGFDVSATVTDDLSLAKVELVYQIEGGQWKRLPMLSAGVDSYSARIPDVDVNGSYLYYYIEAADAAGNRTFHPKGGESDPHKVTILLGTPDPEEPRRYLGILVLFAIITLVAVFLGALVLMRKRRRPQ